MNRSSNAPPHRSSSFSSKQQSELSALTNQIRNALFFMFAGFAIAHVYTFFLWQQLTVLSLPAENAAVASIWTTELELSSPFAFTSNNNNNNQEPWASLSSTFPPPRPGASDRTLEKEMAALGNWQMQSIAIASKKGNPLCSSRNKTLTEKCEAMNTDVGKKMQSEGLPSSFLTRTTSGYNLKDFRLVLGNDMITVHQLSVGFEKILQGLKLHSASTYMGVSNQQDPLDAVAIGDMLWRVQPDLVIELGTSGGGSAFYYSHIMERYNPLARILTIDPAAGKLDGIPLSQWNDHLVKVHCPFCQHSTTMNEWRRDDHGRIRFHRGFPDSNEALAIARAAAATAKTVLIIEDSNHLYDSVRSNMHAYHELVTPGSYFLIQDTRLAGPLQAIQQFLKSKNGTCFDIDKRWEYFIFSQHFDGFLRRRENCTSY